MYKTWADCVKNKGKTPSDLTSNKAPKGREERAHSSRLSGALDQLKCVKCGSLDFSSGDFAVLPIRAESNQTISIPLGEMYEITGLQFNQGDVFCPKCFTDMMNLTESSSSLQKSSAERGFKGGLSPPPSIKVKKYCDVQCNVCLNKYSRSMGTFSWEGWGCATNFSPQSKKFYPGYGSGYDMDVFSVRSENQLKNNWKNIDLSKSFIICDQCLEDGVDKKFLEHRPD